MESAARAPGILRGRGARVAGIQPGYLPWLGFFDQMRRVDLFLVADEMQFTSSGWVHRNRVRGPEGAQWLTLPARPEPAQAIRDVALEPGAPWRRKHLATLRHLYARSPHAAAELDALETALPAEATRVPEVSLATIRFLADALDVRTPVLLSSELGLEARYAARFPERPSPTHRIVAYLEALGASELVEGETGRSYFDVPLFAAHGMRVHFHHYRHPEWPQLHAPFVSHLSALDLLLCAGRAQAARVLRASGEESP